jgi:ElaB/YqjD/DUF883 family membrane-anchored ribosome-binding protein
MGLEVQSLPSSAKDKFDEMFPEFELNREIGQSFMRLTIFENLLKQYSILPFFEYNINQRFDINSDSWSIIREKSELNELDETVSKIKSELNDVVNTFEELLSEEQETLENQLEEWKTNKIDSITNDETEIKEFTQTTINAITNDRTYIRNNKYQIPENFKENLIIPEHKIQKIREIKEKMDSLLEDLEELKSDEE